MYEIILRKQPEKYLKKLDAKTKRIFKKVFEKLEHNPYATAIPLHGELEGLCKVRMANLRIIFLIHKTRPHIEILEIGSRGDIYK